MPIWYHTKTTALLNIQYPIMQGSFCGGLSTPQLVAAVSNMGGLGGYGAYTYSPQEIIKTHRQIKTFTNKPYNLILWVSDTDVKTGTVSTDYYERVKA